MFINTLPIIFAYTQLFTLIEAIVFLAVIFILVYFFAPDANKKWRHKPTGSIYQFLHAAWLGKAPLWGAFWPFFVLVNAALYYIDYRIMTVTYTIASWKTVHGMLLLPIVWWILSVWRCSEHTQHKLFSSAARTLTVCLVFEYFLRFIISTYYPNTFFDCRLLLINHRDCV